MSNNTNTQLQVTSLADNIQSRVRSLIVDSLPPEAMKQVIDSEFSRLTTRTQQGYNTNWASPLELEIRNQLQEQMKVEIRAYIDKNFQIQWDRHGANGILSEELANAVSRVSIQTLITSMVSNAFANLRSQM